MLRRLEAHLGDEMAWPISVLHGRPRDINALEAAAAVNAAALAVKGTVGEALALAIRLAR